MGRFKPLGFHQHRNPSPLCATSDSFARSEYSHSSGDTPSGAGVLHPLSRDTGLCSAVPSNINVSPSTTLNSTILVKGRGASTARTNSTAIPDISAGGGGASLSGLRSHQHRS